MQDLKIHPITHLAHDSQTDEANVGAINETRRNDEKIFITDKAGVDLHSFRVRHACSRIQLRSD